MNKTIAQELADYCVDFSLDEAPEKVVAHAHHLFLDLLGAGLAGVDTKEVDSVIKATLSLNPAGGSALVWGTNVRTSPSGAALINGVIAHARELDDFGGVDHTGAVVIPALMAIVDSFPEISGRKFLEAMIVSYDVGRRVLNSAGGYRPHNHEDGFHSTGSCGSFAAAAAVSKVLGLTKEETSWALGLAGSFTGGTWAFTEDGAMSKRYHVGRAAETGVLVAMLAKNGFTGPTHIFEAKWGGFLATYARDTSIPEELTKDLGIRYDILRSGIKPYAACRDIHSALDCIFKAIDAGVTADDIDKIEVNCIGEMLQMIGSVSVPKSRFEAQLSLPYSVAVALVTGKAFLDEFEEPYLSDERILNLARKVEMIEDKTLPFDCEPYITIHCKDGRKIKDHVPFASGAPQNPLKESAIFDKFFALAGLAMDVKQAEKIKSAVADITNIKDMHDISKLLAVA